MWRNDAHGSHHLGVAGTSCFWTSEDGAEDGGNAVSGILFIPFTTRVSCPVLWAETHVCMHWWQWCRIIITIVHWMLLNNNWKLIMHSLAVLTAGELIKTYSYAAFCADLQCKVLTVVKCHTQTVPSCSSLERWGITVHLVIQTCWFFVMSWLCWEHFI